MNNDRRRNLADWQCRHCNEQIAFGSDRCPECGERQGYTSLDEKVVVGIAAVGGIFFVMAFFALIGLPYAIVSGEYEPGSGIFFVALFLIPGMAFAAIYLQRNWSP